MNLELPTKAAEYLRTQAPAYAKAKAERVYLEQFRKSKKALLMAECKDKTAAMKEVYAYAHPEYVQLLQGLQAAVEQEEALKWTLTAAEAKIEIWRTQSANERQIVGSHR